MLTLPETISAIATLDTEKDIIRQACQRHLGQDKVKDMDPAELSKHLILTYTTAGGVTSKTFILALAAALGQIVALSCIKGQEEVMLSALETKIRLEFYDMLRFKQRLEASMPPAELKELRELVMKEVKNLYG